MNFHSSTYNWISFIIAIIYAVTHIDVTVMFSSFTAFLFQLINFALYFVVIYVGLTLLFKLVQYMYSKVAAH